MVNHSQGFQNSTFAMLLQYPKEEVRNKVDFFHANKHQSFLQVDFNTLSIKVSCKLILSLLIGMIKHSESNQSYKFAISLQCPKKDIRDGVHVFVCKLTSKFLEVGIIAFDGSGQTYPK